jgi:hypothetical protein
MLCVSLYSLLLIVIVSCVPNVVCVSVFSIIDKSQSIINNTETQTTLGTQETVAINNRQSETQTTLGTQETVTINNRQLLSVFLYCLLLSVTVSCVPNVVCVSVLSIIHCH